MLVANPQHKLRATTKTRVRDVTFDCACHQNSNTEAITTKVRQAKKPSRTEAITATGRHFVVVDEINQLHSKTAAKETGTGNTAVLRGGGPCRCSIETT